MKTIKSIIVLTLIFWFTQTGCKKGDCEKTDWKNDCFCTMESAPVCGCDDTTYGNACEAECQGITEYTKGKCK